MSYKRNRSAFESDIPPPPPSYAIFGTPLSGGENARDDGTFVPVWKQTVTDERGRKRLHGAFTGGFSAGYFNTVGSKEGWTPSTFVSSRTNRWKGGADKDGEHKSKGQRVEDFMDEEDLAEREEERRVRTNEGFGGLGGTAEEVGARGGDRLMDLIRPGGETMGVKLLQRMGWRVGQGVGRRVRRKARGDEEAGTETHWFAPEDSKMVSFAKKNDTMGLGYDADKEGGPLKKPDRNGGNGSDAEENEDGEEEPSAFRPVFKSSKGTANKTPARKSGFGVGILNDTGSDDEDPYEIGPKISYNRTIGGSDKKKNKTKPNAKTCISPSTTSGLRKPSSIGANPLLRSGSVFVSSRKTPSGTAFTPAPSNAGFHKCHDGCLPLDGFVLSVSINPSDALNSKTYAPPRIPEGWKSAKSTSASLAAAAAQQQQQYLSAADAARASELNPSARGAMIGEAPLKGPSVFELLSPEARARLDAATAGLASRFTKAKAPVGPDGQAGTEPVVQDKPADPAVEAAKMGMFGELTRSKVAWKPARLVCKRFGVSVPDVAEEGEQAF